MDTPARIPLIWLARYMTAGPSHQLRILTDYFAASELDRIAMVRYHSETRQRIRAFHRSERPPSHLTVLADELVDQAAHAEGMYRQQQLRSNAEAIRAYAALFGTKTFEVLDQVPLGLSFHDVAIGIQPDLHVCEDGQEKLIKLHFAKTWHPSATVGNIVARGMYDAACRAGLAVAASSILYLDVHTGASYRGKSLGQRMRGDLGAAVFQIAACWEMLALANRETRRPTRVARSE